MLTRSRLLRGSKPVDAAPLCGSVRRMTRRWVVPGRCIAGGAVCLACWSGVSACSTSAKDGTHGPSAPGTGGEAGSDVTTPPATGGAATGGAATAETGGSGASGGAGGAATAETGGSGASGGAGGAAGAGTDGTGASGGGAGGAGASGGAGSDYPLPAEAGEPGFHSWTYNGQPVGFYLPETTDEPLPVVMFLHGCGGNPVDPNWWTIDALNAVEPCAVLLPYRPADESPTCSAWGGTYDDALRPAMVDALAGLDAVVARYGLDSERQYLHGESMGAEGVLALLVEYPSRFAGAVAVAGYTLDRGAEQMAQTPLWLLHGSGDTINPYSSIETIHQSILDVGGTLVKFTEYADMDHNPSIQAARMEPGLLEWLLAQRHDGILREVPIETPEREFVSVTVGVTDLQTAHEGMSIDFALLAGAVDCGSWATAAAYTAEATVVDGACTISLSDVLEGAYTACALIDVDENAQPTPGDLAGQRSVVVSGDTTETWSASDWTSL